MGRGGGCRPPVGANRMFPPQAPPVAVLRVRRMPLRALLRAAASLRACGAYISPRFLSPAGAHRTARGR